MHPEFISLILTPVSFKKAPSIPISPKPTAANGYKLTGFIYNGKFYAMNDVWDVLDYDGSYLIAQYEEDTNDWGPLV